jgi:hypothetical protein
LLGVSIILVIKASPITYGTEQGEEVAFPKVVLPDDVVTLRVEADGYPVDISIVVYLHTFNSHKPLPGV